MNLAQWFKDCKFFWYSSFGRDYLGSLVAWKGVWNFIRHFLIQLLHKGCGNKSVYLQILAIPWKYTDLLPHPLYSLPFKFSKPFHIWKTFYTSESECSTLCNVQCFYCFPWLIFHVMLNKLNPCNPTTLNIFND